MSVDDSLEMKEKSQTGNQERRYRWQPSVQTAHSLGCWVHWWEPPSLNTSFQGEWEAWAAQDDGGGALGTVRAFLLAWPFLCRAGRGFLPRVMPAPPWCVPALALHSPPPEFCKAGGGDASLVFWRSVEPGPLLPFRGRGDKEQRAEGIQTVLDPSFVFLLFLFFIFRWIIQWLCQGWNIFLFSVRCEKRKWILMKCFGLLYRRLPVSGDSHALNRCQLLYPLACKRQKIVVWLPCSALSHSPFPRWEELPANTKLIELWSHMNFRKLKSQGMIMTNRSPEVGAWHPRSWNSCTPVPSGGAGFGRWPKLSEPTTPRKDLSLRQFWKQELRGGGEMWQDLSGEGRAFRWRHRRLRICQNMS